MKRKLLLKRVSITSVLLFCFATMFAQNEKKFTFKNREYIVKESVVDKLGEAVVEDYKANSPDELMYHNYMATSSFELLDRLPPGKNIQPIERNFTTTNISDFDLYKENVVLTDKNQFFKFGDKYLLVYSQFSFEKKFSHYIKSITQ